MMRERRRFPRERVECSLQLKAIALEGDHMIRNSFSNNISAVGMSITSFDFYPVKGRVHLKIFSDALTSLVETIGRIVWIEELPLQKRFRIGIEFVDSSESFIGKIKEVLNMYR